MSLSSAASFGRAVAGAETLAFEDEDTPGGFEVDAVEAFARQRGLEVEWTIGAEHELMAQLEKRQLDVVVGGITTRSPYKKSVALTAAPIQAREGPDVVAAVPLGENRWLLEWDRFLSDRSSN